MAKHGELIEEGCARYCEFCSWHRHGPLYTCSSYPEDIKQNIKKSSDQFTKNLQDPKWIKEQMDNGVSGEAITIFRFFAGL